MTNRDELVAEILQSFPNDKYHDLTKAVVTMTIALLDKAGYFDNYKKIDRILDAVERLESKP